jgi:putative transposase
MPRQRYTTEQVINKLRQAEVLTSQGRSIREVAKELLISEHTYYCWRREYEVPVANRRSDLRCLRRRMDG